VLNTITTKNAPKPLVDGGKAEEGAVLCSLLEATPFEKGAGVMLDTVENGTGFEVLVKVGPPKTD